MLTVAYLANQFPTPTEPYVGEEIAELRRRGLRVISGSIRRPLLHCFDWPSIVVLSGDGVWAAGRALWLCITRFDRIMKLLRRVLLQGRESPSVRVKALMHTFLGAVYAAQLCPYRPQHIHIHHGYFGSWVGMTAAELLGIGFSMTLHGSDVLLNAPYLDAKLANCSFCVTVSEYNRRYICEHYPEFEEQKVVVSHLGVDVPQRLACPRVGESRRFSMLAVGRLHAVKNHRFLIRACARLRDIGVDFACRIAGGGPERMQLESLVSQYRLQDRIEFLGPVPRERMDSLYDSTDTVVLTSHSEGIPLVLMEAMARGRIVIAPTITGVPELVIPGETGFLYQPGSIDEFVRTVRFVHQCARESSLAVDSSLSDELEQIRKAAHAHVLENFNRKKNLQSFVDVFLRHIAPEDVIIPDENPILQQVQLSV